MVQPDPQAQRAFALDVVNRLREAGYVAVWAGGCVRDQLLGRTPQDYDVATDAKPDQIRQVFGNRRTLAIGAAFGVITVVGNKRVGQIDVATFRQDAEYLDGRRPERVIFSTPEEDASRRDFTINGMFFDPIADQVLDYVGGKQDLSQGIVRAIGDPRERFAEDKLRLLRAVRFASTYGFTIEPQTLQAIQEMAPQVTVVSAERIGMEMRRMLLSDARLQAIQLLHKSGLLRVLLPQIDATVAAAGREWQAVSRALSQLHNPSLAVAVAALLHQSARGEAATRVGRAWRLTNHDTKRAAWLIDHLDDVAAARTTAWPTLQRLLIHEGSDELLTLYESLHGVDNPELVHCRQLLSLPAEELNPQPLITGDDLIAHGIPPGKLFRHLLDRVRDAQLDGQIATQAEALRLVEQLRDTP